MPFALCTSLPLHFLMFLSQVTIVTSPTRLHPLVLYTLIAPSTLFPATLLLPAKDTCSPCFLMFGTLLPLHVLDPIRPCDHCHNTSSLDTSCTLSNVLVCFPFCLFCVLALTTHSLSMLSSVGTLLPLHSKMVIAQVTPWSMHPTLTLMYVLGLDLICSDFFPFFVLGPCSTLGVRSFSCLDPAPTARHEGEQSNDRLSRQHSTPSLLFHLYYWPTL